MLEGGKAYRQGAFPPVPGEEVAEAAGEKEGEARRYLT